MSPHRITIVIAAAAAAVMLMTLPTAATALGKEPTPPGTVAVAGKAPGERAKATPDLVGALGTVPLKVEEALWKVGMTSPDPDVWFAWDAEREVVQAHHSGHEKSSLTAGLRRLGKTVEIVEDAVPRSELLAEAERIALLRTTTDGTPIAFAAPNTAGDGLVVGLVSDESLPMMRGGDEAAVEDEAPVEGLSDYPITVERSPGFEVSSRLLYGKPFIAGARISRPVGENKYKSCTTSFPIGIPFATGWKSMILTAHHCGGPETDWMKGAAGATTKFGWVPTGEAKVSDAIAVMGPNANESIEHAPYVFWGDTNTSSVAPIRGAVVPIVGNHWCHSGSYSGTWCGNQVVDTGVATCYGLTGPCYTGLVRTLQVNGVSSVGSGDSGGPSVAASLDGNGYVQARAAGTISGMSNADPNSCQGVPGKEGGRECSAQVLIAPISLYLEQTGRSIFITNK